MKSLRQVWAAAQRSPFAKRFLKSCQGAKRYLTVYFLKPVFICKNLYATSKGENNMYIVNEEDKEYRFGDSGPKYLMKGPRMNFALVQFQAGQDFKAHYHNVMEENFYILEGEVDIVVDGVVNHLRPGQMIHIEPGEIHYVVNNSGAPMKMISTLAPYTNPDKIDVENYTY